jgi:hypothetical protein
MDERSGTVRLVESRPDVEARGLVATVPRGEIEEALRSDAGPVDLLLDVERVAADGEGRETRRIALAWESQDLERLLTTTSGDEVSLTFEEDEVRRLLDEDVEAHGMREKLAVLSVVAGIAAAGAGSAAAAVAPDGGGGARTPVAAAAPATASEVSTGLTGVTVDRVAPSEISTGLGDPQAAPARQAPRGPSEISTGIVQAPAVTPAEVTTGITEHPTATPVSASPTSDDWAPGPEGVALVAGMILAVSAAGFALRAQRRRPATP